MTFTEAAIEVLRREGKPLHFKKIAEIAVRDSLLDHVGKTPEETMADQLAAHFRLPRPERRVIPVQAGTFALAEWGLEEDPQGLEALIEPPDESELPYRGRERHPVPSRDLARGAPRAEGGRGRRREEEERRGRRFPPPAEVAYEILAGAGRPLSITEIAAQGAERLLMPDAFVRDSASLGAALSEDNRRREAAGRRPLFQLEGETVALIAQPEPGERPAPVAAPRPPTGPAELRRVAMAALRRRLRECEPPTLEHVAVKLLERQGFRDLKVAKRGRDHVIYTARRRLGLADLRHGVRVVRTSAEVSRRDVSELRRDLGHYGAQLGVVICAGDAARDARSEASAAGQLPVILLCGEALAEAMSESGVGCVPVVLPDVDEDFFRAATEAAEKEEAARRARREEPERREGREREGREREGREREGREREGREREGRDREARAEERGPRPGPAVVSATFEGVAPQGAPPRTGAPAVIEVPAELADEEIVSADLLEPVEDEDVEGSEADEEEGLESGSEVGAEAVEGTAPGAGEPGVPGERRRRRRRRRRRGGRGRGREGAVPGAQGAPPGPAGTPGAGAEAAAVPSTAEAAPAQPGGEGGARSSSPDEGSAPAREQPAPAPAPPPLPGDDGGTPGA